MPLFWAARLRRLPLLEFFARVSVHGLHACASAKKLLSPVSHTFVKDRPCPPPLSHVFRLPHSHSSFPLHPEVPVNVPHLPTTAGLSCSCALTWRRKCSYRELGGSINTAAAVPVLCWQPLLGPCRDHVCFFHCNATLKNYFSS